LTDFSFYINISVTGWLDNPRKRTVGRESKLRTVSQSNQTRWLHSL